MKKKDFKEGYYYYAENDKSYLNFKQQWRVIGKIMKINSDNIEYKIIKGNFHINEGRFFLDSAHNRSIKGISKTIKGLRVYMI